MITKIETAQQETIVEGMENFKLDRKDIKYLPIDELETNPVQPAVRVKESAIRSLFKTVQFTHFLSPLIVCFWNQMWVVVDGHRRLAAARQIRKEFGEHLLVELPCLQVSTEKFSPTVWFIMLNAATAKVGGNNWFEVWAATTGMKDRAFALSKLPH